MSLHAIVDAHQKGFDENVYLDAASRTKIEETGEQTLSLSQKTASLLLLSQTVFFHLSHAVH